MIDFTKEELQQLVKWATTDIDLNPSALEVTLFDKIQTMIDNYPECDHAPDFGFSLHYTTPKCIRCGEYY